MSGVKATIVAAAVFVGAAALALGGALTHPDTPAPASITTRTPTEATTPAAGDGAVWPSARVVARAQRRLTRLPVAAAVDRDGYDVDAFGGWSTRDGCTTRDRIMLRDMVVAVIADDCNVVGGTLTDPYTGDPVTYDESVTAMSVQIDHVYPRKAAYDAAAWAWDEQTLRRFTNDPRNLLAVDGAANASKGDQTPGEWMPVTAWGSCRYATRYVAVAAAYALPVTVGDRDALRLALDICDGTRP